MKPLFIIGSPRIEPYSYVEDNQFKGTYAPLHYAVHYYFYQKFNVNLVDLGPRINSECFMDGSCSGALSYLQSGAVNYVDEFVQDQFPTLPINLTIGPTVKQEECHLINRPTTKDVLRAQDFIVSINQQFDYQVSVTCLIFCLGFMCLVVLVKQLKLDQVNIRFSSWSLYEIAFNRRYLPFGSVSSSIGIVFSWFLFFMLLIVSCTFQTGLIKSKHFQKIDTLQDVLTYSLVPSAFKYRFCRYPIEKSNIPIFRKIGTRLNIIDPENLEPMKIFDLMNNSSHVLIADKSFGIRFKGFLCMIKGEKESMESPLYTSTRPFDRLKIGFVLSSETYAETTRLAIKLAYSAFETGNLDNPKIRGIDFTGAGLSNYYGRCTRETSTSTNIILAPLTKGYFKSASITLGVVSVISFMVFLIELMFPPAVNEMNHQLISYY